MPHQVDRPGVQPLDKSDHVADMLRDQAVLADAVPAFRKKAPQAERDDAAVCRPRTDHNFTIFDTAIGRCGIAWGPRGINAVQLPMGSEDKTRARIRQRYGDIAEAKPTSEVQSAIDGIVELLAGKPNDLSDIVLDLD